jgi:hypothetical protein
VASSAWRAAAPARSIASARSSPARSAAAAACRVRCSACSRASSAETLARSATATCVCAAAGVLGSLGTAAYTGHMPLGVAVPVIAVTGVLILLTTLITSVMPQKSEHRTESIQAFFAHRRRMTVLKQKGRIAAQRDANLTVFLIPTSRAAPNLSPASTRPRRSSRTVSG